MSLLRTVSNGGAASPLGTALRLLGGSLHGFLSGSRLRPAPEICSTSAGRGATNPFGVSGRAIASTTSLTEDDDKSGRPTTPWVRQVISGVDLMRHPKYNKGLAFTDGTTRRWPQGQCSAAGGGSSPAPHGVAGHAAPAHAWMPAAAM